MALNAIGGLARGLAEGMNMGMQWRNQQELIDLRKKESQRDDEIHELRKDQYASEKEIRDRRNRALAEIADYTQNMTGGGAEAPVAATTPSIQDPSAPSFEAPAQQQTPSAIHLAGPIPQGGLAMSAPAAPFAADNPAGALAPSAPAAPAGQAAPDIKPAKILERGMVTGMYSPKALTDIANIFAKNGLHEEGVKYMNQAYEAKKRGAVDASMALMQNNPQAAAEALQAGGVQLEGMPVKSKPDDPEDMNWKLNIAGQGEKTVNIRDWIRSTMNAEEFFKEEDRRKKAEREAAKDERDAAMDERKQSFVEQKGRAELGLEARKTNAQIGFLKSRSELAEANADKADRWEPGGGGLRASRSSEAQINTAIKRRDTSFDRVSSVKNEDTGKFEVDPMRRQELDSASNQYQNFIEDQQGEELDARQHHKFTDAMLSYPVGGTPEQVEEWQRKELMPRMGLRSKAKAADPASSPAEQGARMAEPVPATGGLAAAPQQPAGPKPGSLAWMKEQANARQAIKQEMEAVQRALQAPNLSVEQKQALALKAQEIAARRDSLK